MDNNKFQFVYLKDPVDNKRVVTIIYVVDENCIKYNYAINRIVKNNTTELDYRLKKIIGKELFNDIQKKFRKKFGSDQHRKSQARNVTIGKFRKNRYHLSYNKEFDGSPIFNILDDICTKYSNYSKLFDIAYYYREDFS